jgi:hypothetical protein
VVEIDGACNMQSFCQKTLKSYHMGELCISGRIITECVLETEGELDAVHSADLG